MKFRLTTRLLTVIIVTLTVVVVGIGVALAASSLPAFCATCKSHKPIVAAYHEGPHQGVNCELCHSKPGPFYFLTAKMEALQQPIAQITGKYEEPILASVLNQSCRQCHTNDKLFNVISAQGINVQHKHLIEAGFLCTRCHSTVGHPGSVPVGSVTKPSMDQCLICHNNDYTDAQGQVATADCGLCHTKRNYSDEPASHKEPDWGTRHGAVGILSTCSACHKDPNDCRKCHGGVEMPHPEDWLTVHGGRSKVVGEKTCLTCHESKEYCNTCHQVKMPHPADFVVKHPKEAEKADQTCFNCHEVANCQACHEEHAMGDPRAHDLFKAQPWTPQPTPSPSSL